MTIVGLHLTPDQKALRAAVRELCARFPDSYWRELDAARAYPERFVRALTEAGYLAAMIPQEYGGAGLDLGGDGGAGDYDVERQFRETRLYVMAPVSNKAILAYFGQHVLGMTRSY